MMSWVKHSTKEFHIWLTVDGYRGYFEHDLLGEDHGGGLWFENKSLTDYDGVYDLPKEIVDFLIEKGYNCEYLNIPSNG